MSVIIEGGISIQGNIAIGDVPLPLKFIVTQGIPDQIVMEVGSGGDAIIEESN